jgi:hypothetical protein
MDMRSSIAPRPPPGKLWGAKLGRRCAQTVEKAAGRVLVIFWVSGEMVMVRARSWDVVGVILSFAPGVVVGVGYVEPRCQR